MKMAGGGDFTIAGAPLAKNSYAVELGALVDLDGVATASLAYTGRFSKYTKAHGAEFKLQKQF